MGPWVPIRPWFPSSPFGPTTPIWPLEPMMPLHPGHPRDPTLAMRPHGARPTHQAGCACLPEPTRRPKTTPSSSRPLRPLTAEVPERAHGAGVTSGSWHPAFTRGASRTHRPDLRLHVGERVGAL